MLELSPLVTAASAPASSMPASMQAVAVEADALHGRAREVGAEPGERVAPAVDDGDGVAVAAEDAGERRADPAAPDDDDVHGGGV